MYWTCQTNQRVPLPHSNSVKWGQQQPALVAHLLTQASIEVAHSCLFLEPCLHLVPFSGCSLLVPLPDGLVPDSASVSVSDNNFPPQPWLSWGLNSSYFDGSFSTVVWFCYLINRRTLLHFYSLCLKRPELCSCWICVHSVTTYMFIYFIGYCVIC